MPTYKVSRTNKDDSPIDPANFFGFETIGTDIQMDVCFTDLKKFNLANKEMGSAEESELPQVQTDTLHRFVMSPSGFITLWSGVLIIAELLKKAGTLPEDIEQRLVDRPTLERMD